ncbi:MAG: hypothetical protein Q9M92_02685 [Enterobacterales bacterium]|nr:hypothetical protein [Enterobacterales bacterium]
MITAIIIIILVFLFLVGGMITLLKNKSFPLPKDYDPKKNPGYKDEEDDDASGF